MLSTTGTNNAYQSANRAPWLLAALLVVAVLRLWRLPEAGPLDYDSVRNWQVVQELAQGNFAHLFHHGSPGFLLLYAPVATLTHKFLVFQAINAGVGVLGVGLFAAWVAQVAQLSRMESAAVTLLGGTSLLLTFSGRDFTMSSASLVVFAGLLRSHHARLQRLGTVSILRVAGWLALGLCMNYKFLFTVPVLVLLEAVQTDGLWRHRGLWVRVVLVLAAPYILFGALGVAVGLPWYRWLGFYYRTVVPVAANAAGRQTTLHFDLLYYPRYLAQFESPLLLLGLGLAAYLVWREWRRQSQSVSVRPALLAYLLIWSSCLLAGMLLLIKAPRGLLFAYLPLAALAVLSGRRVLPGWALMGIVAVAVGWNVVRIQQELYAPLPSPYPKLAAWLRAHGGTKIASTVGLGLAPYLTDNQTLTVINDERQLASLHRQGYQFVLLDGYWRVAGVCAFDSLRRQQPIAAWPAPQLQCPLLFLEHSEYTGLSFAETLAASTTAAADSLPLRLYRLP